MSRGLLDTSVVTVADAAAAGAGATTSISVVTVGELRAGVALAPDPTTRAARQARLAAIKAAFAPLPVDEPVAEAYGDILASARKAGRVTKATDLLIVATAAATGRVLWTLDTRQARLARVVGVALGAADNG